MSSLPVRMKNIQSKVATTFFYLYKSMGIFTDAEGQVTLQSVVRSGKISNSSKILWLSSRMEKIQSKVKAIEWPDFSDPQGQIT